MQLFEELKRRNVFRVGAAYLVGAWLLLQVADLVLENLAAPDFAMRWLMAVLALGFPLALVFAWAFELTPEGVRRDAEVDRSASIARRTGRRLDRLIIAGLIVVIALLVAERTLLATREESPPAGGALEPTAANAPDGAMSPDFAAAEGQSVAVLPFANLSPEQEREYFADGLTEEILNALAQLPSLKVTARTSSFAFKGQNRPIAEIARTLGVEHVVEGSVRGSGQDVRITAQLIRATDGFHLWSDTYDRNLADELVVQEQIAIAVAEALQVVMDEDQRAEMTRLGTRDPAALVAFQKARDLHERAHGSEPIIETLRQANVYLDQAIALAPGLSEAYALHSDLYSHLLVEHASGQVIEGFGPDDIPAAAAAMEADFRAAAEYARNANMRQAADIDRMIVSGQWRGLASRVAELFPVDPCEDNVWIHLVATPFGWARDSAALYGSLAECDPLVSSHYVHGVSAALWRGRFDEAEALARRGTELAGNEWLWELRGVTLTLVGNAERARSVISQRISDRRSRTIALLHIEALEGDREAAAALMAELAEVPDVDTVDLLWASAWIGDREGANRHAARLDAHPYGHQPLLMANYFCLCGAPFDLESTPNFARKLDVSGLAWPPASPLPFPLKEW